MGTYVMRYHGENGEEDTDPTEKDTDITFEAASDKAARIKAQELAEDTRAYNIYERTGVIQRKKK